VLNGGKTIMSNEPTIKDGFLTNPFFNDWLMPDFTKNNLMKTDIKEVGDKYQLDIELPGVEKKDIDLSLSDEYLTVKASVNEEKKEENKSYLHRERFVGTSTRSYYVGNVDMDTIEASFNNGILSVSFPKENEKAQKESRIEIK
jgi:HSP20 family molecular chaperone IbpA